MSGIIEYFNAVFPLQIPKLSSKAYAVVKITHVYEGGGGDDLVHGSSLYQQMVAVRNTETYADWWKIESEYEKLGKSILTLTIKDKKIIDAQFTGYDLFGNEKGEDYGSLTGKDSADYKKAQVAVKAIKNYPQQLLETQDINKVDAISGASISYSQFVETANAALKEATE